jgi:Zn finger protein HypA/HybF involved in hydrogenase expression
MNKPKSEAIAVECMECGRKFKTRSLGPVCPRCGGVDVEVRDDAAARRRRDEAAAS